MELPWIVLLAFRMHPSIWGWAWRRHIPVPLRWYHWPYLLLQMAVVAVGILALGLQLFPAVG